jgi:hypothetical protein
MMQSCFAASLVAKVASRALFLGTGRHQVQPMTHLVEKEKLQRANAALLMTVVCGGLGACALGAAIYDFGRLFAAVVN